MKIKSKWWFRRKFRECLAECGFECCRSLMLGAIDAYGKEWASECFAKAGVDLMLPES